MSDSESSSDTFEDAVETVEIVKSPSSRAKRNTMKRGTISSAEVAAAGAMTEERKEHQIR